jgi:hypothetical protein
MNKIHRSEDAWYVQDGTWTLRHPKPLSTMSLHLNLATLWCERLALARSQRLTSTSSCAIGI